jgi:hypothetical protein
MPFFRRLRDVFVNRSVRRRCLVICEIGRSPSYAKRSKLHLAVPYSLAPILIGVTWLVASEASAHSRLGIVWMLSGLAPPATLFFSVIAEWRTDPTKLPPLQVPCVGFRALVPPRLPPRPGDREQLRAYASIEDAAGAAEDSTPLGTEESPPLFNAVLIYVRIGHKGQLWRQQVAPRRSL